MLWFDVENERYTTKSILLAPHLKLWFDVENERYTTECRVCGQCAGCGLM